MIEHPILAYLFDDAIGLYGAWVENQLAETDKNGKPKRTLADILDVHEPARQLTKADMDAWFGAG